MGVIIASPGSGVAWQVPAEEAGTLRAIRQALAATPPGAGRVALCLPGPMAPHRRRAARIVLRDAARADAARVLEAAADGDLLLLGATAEEAARAEAILAPLLATPDRQGPGPPLTWRLPADAAALLAWAEAADRRAAAPGPAAPQAGGAPPSLDALLDGLGPDAPEAHGVWFRRAVIRLAPGRPPALAWRRLALSRRGLAACLGPALGEDPDLLDHAAEVLVQRCLRRPQAGPRPPAMAPAMLPLPLGEAAMTAPEGTGVVGVLPLAATLAPGAAARRERLAEAGWRLAIDGLDAAALRLLQPAALPPEALLLLRWSPALGDERAMQAALRPLDPARLVLTGCDAPEALAWGLARGIPHLAGSAIEALRGDVRAGERR